MSRRPCYVELHAHSSHSLLDGVVSPRELVAHAAASGMAALALTDQDGLYGAVPFIHAAHAAGLKPLLGAEVTLADPHLPGPAHLTLLAASRRGYANLCRLLTLAHRDQPKGHAQLAPQALAEHASGLIALSGGRQGPLVQRLMAGQFAAALAVARDYARCFGPEHFYVELQRHYHPGEHRLLGHLVGLADRLGLPVVATGDVHYLHPAQREVHDVLTCIREHVTLVDAGDRLRPNDEYRFRAPEEMADLFATVPAALENTRVIADHCVAATEFLLHGPQTLPNFPAPEGTPPQAYLQRLCTQALQRRYPKAPPQAQLAHELAVIQQLGLANYFLIVWDIVRFARAQGIRCQGRGSAANSLVAYLLGITPIDPVAADLVFERFLSPQRQAPPDIDIDFAADRREAVLQYALRRYGAEHAAMACTLVTFRARSAVRDVGRVLGFPPALVERLVATLDVNDPRSIAESQALVATFGEALAARPYQHLLRLVPQLDGLPRHLGIHNGGVVLSGPPLCELVPLEPATMPNRTVTQWDKAALEDAGFIKIDLLGLRMLSAVEDAVTIVESLGGTRPDLAHLHYDDPAVYDMLCRGEVVGVFQVESRAQASLIPNFQPRNFADLVVQIALIRPGPIQANVVHPYLRRRLGREPVRYPHPRLQRALAETLGVMVFQEQVLKVARDLAGFSPGEAEQLRRCLGRKRAQEELLRFQARFLAGAQANGVPKPVAAAVFNQLQAFGSYAFPKSHAAAFAVLTYQSAWLRHYHPAAFFAALLRHQPLGFYSPNVIVAEARRQGIAIHAVDVQASDVRASVEPEGIRLGLAVVRGVGEAGAQQILEARQPGGFPTLAAFCRRTRLGRRAVEALILAGAFDRWGIPRRQLLWDLQAALADRAAPPHLDLPTPPGMRPRFAPLSEGERVWAEVATTGISAEQHLTARVAQQLRQLGVTSSAALDQWPPGTRLRVGGVVVARQRPPTAGGTAFVALEDAAGIVNVILHPDVYAQSREVLRRRFVVVEGRLQRQGQACSVLATRVLALAVEV